MKMVGNWQRASRIRRLLRSRQDLTASQRLSGHTREPIISGRSLRRTAVCHLAMNEASMNEQGSISPLGVQHTINSLGKHRLVMGRCFLSKAYGQRSKVKGFQGGRNEKYIKANKTAVGSRKNTNFAPANEKHRITRKRRIL